MDRPSKQEVPTRKPQPRRRPAVLVIVMLWGAPAAAQTPPPNAVVEAQRLRDAGNFAGAAQLLRAQLVQRPDDGDAARLLAQTLYWLKDLEGARAVYETTIGRHPSDVTARLQYARMLAETGKRVPARELLT